MVGEGGGTGDSSLKWETELFPGGLVIKFFLGRVGGGRGPTYNSNALVIYQGSGHPVDLPLR